jgi:glycosyltransferase involved in cell wall biosynthesis
MKLSVITVCFNSIDTISQNIESVATQTYPNVEHIIIDGASTDGTAQAISLLCHPRDDTPLSVMPAQERTARLGCGIHLEISSLDATSRHAAHDFPLRQASERHVAGMTQLGNNRISHFISEPDNGIYDAMNKGIKLATGDYIGFLNADDLYASSKSLEHIAQALLAEKLDAVFGDIEFFKPNNPRRIIRRYDSARFNPKKLACGWMPAHPGLFLHKRIFEQYGIFNSNYRIAGDFEFIARVFYKSEIKYRYLAEVLVRMRTGGISTQGWRNTLLLNQEVLRACRENNIESNYFKLFLKYPMKFLEYLTPWLNRA